MATARISDLTPHPMNARRGDIDAIADSLRRHGMYSPVVIDQNGVILAGHHVVQAARKIGWTEVAVHRIDVDAETAKAILVTDNRASDLAMYDTAGLVDLLHSLPDLDGTGFTPEELAELEDGVLSEDTAPIGTGAEPLDQPGVKVRAGQYRFHVRQDPYDDWHTLLMEEAVTPRGARRLVRMRLGLTEPAKPSKGASDPSETSVPPATVAVETVPCAELVPLDGNARQGDIGAICASLSRFGQYKPITITADNVVIKGNHTLAAARALGWTSVQVVRAPVDREEAIRIALVDNRTSDLAGYDDDTFRALVRSLRSYDGTGWDLEDVSDLLQGGPSRPSKSPRSVSVEIGAVKFRVGKAQFAEWATELPIEMEETEIANRLGISPTDCVFG